MEKVPNQLLTDGQSIRIQISALNWRPNAIRNNSTHRHGEVRAVAVDKSKALDRVWHKSLLVKPRGFGLCTDFI